MRGSVLCGGNNQVPTQGVAHLDIHIGLYTETLPFIVMPLDATHAFQLILGQKWLKPRMGLLDYETSSVSIYHNGRRMSFGHSTCASEHVPILTAVQFRRDLAKPDSKFYLMYITPTSQSESHAKTDDAAVTVPGQHRAKCVLEQFSSVFKPIPPGIPYKGGIGHTIQTGDHPPVSRAMYRMSPKEKLCAEQMVAELLEKGWIQPSSSPYSSPILFVSKKDGGLRMCVDYRALNGQTVKDRYPLPRIDDLLDKLLGASVFSSLDMASGYHQIKIAPEDVEKTAFITHKGLYEYLVLPFGLCNAPAAFQREMNRLFGHLPFVIVYMDDILIFSKSEEEHEVHLTKILQILQTQQLYAKLSKCSFFQTEAKFLGHVVSAQGIHVDPVKISAIQNWEEPKTATQLRSFLGLCNFFKKFVPNFSSLAAPLTDLTSRDTDFYFDETTRTAFQALKRALTNTPVLAVPDDTQPYVMVCDASGFGCGAVLMQDSRPVAYWSYKMNPAERNYHAGEQELLAVVKALEHWRHYLEGAVSLKVVTDHKPNITIDTRAPTQLNRRQVRWQLFLSRFDIIWEWQKGASNIADPLSRQPAFLNSIIENDSDDTPLSNDLLQRISDGYSVDSLFQDARKTRQFRFDGQYWRRQSCIVVPDTDRLRDEIIRLHHDPPYAGHLGVDRTLSVISRHFWWPGIYTQVKSYVIHCDICQRIKVPTQKYAGLLQPLDIPSRSWESVSMDFITQLPPTKNGHTAIVVFVDRLTKMVHFCPTTDTLTAEGFATIFIREIFAKHGMPDNFVSDRDTRFTSDFFREFCNKLQIDQHMSTAFHPQTDGQTERMNQYVETILSAYVSPTQDDWDEYLPLAEFAINNAYQSAVKNTPFFLNFGCHPKSPADIDVSVRETESEDHADNIKLALQRARQCMKEAQHEMAKQANKHRRHVEFKEGDFVLLHSKNLKLQFEGSKKLMHRYFGPFKVLKRIGNLSYEIETPASMKCHDVFHVSLLKIYKGRGNLPIIVPPPALLPTGHKEFEIERITDHRVKEDNFPEFLVYWKDDSQPTWLTAEDLGNAKDVLKRYCDEKKLVLQLTKSAKKKQTKKAASKQVSRPRRRTRVSKNNFMAMQMFNYYA